MHVMLFQTYVSISQKARTVLAFRKGTALMANNRIAYCYFRIYVRFTKRRILTYASDIRRNQSYAVEFGSTSPI